MLIVPAPRPATRNHRGRQGPAQLAAVKARRLVSNSGNSTLTPTLFGTIEAAPADGGGTRLTFRRESGAAAVVYRVEPAAPHRIVALVLESAAASSRRAVEVEPINWNNLESRLEREAELGFSGTVLVRRGGRLVLHRGFGMAQRDENRPNTTQTILAIGSVPIDLTKAAVLKLAETGKLRTSDPITR